ncbi:MAG: hypothetical protein J7K81_07090 [Methanophagales archaeon]|nr:hypothetical protein [Methanophagales archaeon]
MERTKELLKEMKQYLPLSVYPSPELCKLLRKRPKLRELQYAFLENSRVKVLEKGFIGRRRQIQQGLRCLRKDMGKSCLAGKFCDRFKDWGAPLLVYI